MNDQKLSAPVDPGAVSQLARRIRQRATVAGALADCVLDEDTIAEVLQVLEGQPGAVSAGSGTPEQLLRDAEELLGAVLSCPLLHDENGHAYLKVRARSITDLPNLINGFLGRDRSAEGAAGSGAIRDLIAEWRVNVVRARANADNAAIPAMDRRQCFGVSQAYEQCADELAALIQAEGSAPETPKGNA